MIAYETSPDYDGRKGWSEKRRFTKQCHDTDLTLMNLIVEKSPSIEWYTDLYPFLSLIESTVRKYAWLWTDVDVSAPLPVPYRNEGKYWLSGETLLEYVEHHPQFNWSVFSAIPPKSKEAAEKVDCYPFGDGNRNLWVDTPTPQHPHADFEIVCWDSGSTLLIGADEDLADAFRRAYPGATDLDELIAKHD